MGGEWTLKSTGRHISGGSVCEMDRDLRERRRLTELVGGAALVVSDAARDCVLFALCAGFAGVRAGEMGPEEVASSEGSAVSLAPPVDTRRNVAVRVYFDRSIFLLNAQLCDTYCLMRCNAIYIYSRNTRVRKQVMR